MWWIEECEEMEKRTIIERGVRRQRIRKSNWLAKEAENEEENDEKQQEAQKK